MLNTPYCLHKCIVDILYHLEYIIWTPTLNSALWDFMSTLDILLDTTGGKKNISYIVKGVVSDEHTITHEYFMCGISHMTKAIHKTDRAAIMDINHTY